MKLIVGLGNPGERYAGTRHNAGWRVAEELARRAGAAAWRERFDAALAEARWGGRKAVLARPLTYMNNSGQAVRQLMDFWKLQPADLLVALDDLALDLGRIRLRPEGSAGGHNGLESVIAHLGHEGFARLRVGIGPGPAAQEQAAFVLSEFQERERPVIDEAVRRAADAAECWITRGLAEAMNRFNRPRDE
ncbi:MAG: aminoacyl-tRNA hydrolase [Planctomycetes bacterium]|nr:aminoacyl-tRNA hydrolase [Planctomycetota bacterium]